MTVGQATSLQQAPAATAESPRWLWCVDSTLVTIHPFRVAAFLIWRAQSLYGRWSRLLALIALTPPALVLSLVNRGLALRIPYLTLRGMTRDRLEVLGEEFVEYVLQREMRSGGLAQLGSALDSKPGLVLFSSAPVELLRPLARHLGLPRVLGNRLDYRDNEATGRLEGPVIVPRHWLARLFIFRDDGRMSLKRAVRRIRPAREAVLRAAIMPAARPRHTVSRPVVSFESGPRPEHLSVTATLRDRHVLIAGVTGFIGKVWTVHALRDLPELGRLYLLIRRNRTRTARERFERMVAESPVFTDLHELHGDRLAEWLAARVEIVEGDVTAPSLGIDAEVATRLRRDLDVFINSTGLTDFTPDLRSAINANIDATLNIADFVQSCDHAALLHLSTCYVAGRCDGRVIEHLVTDYNPRGRTDFSAAGLVAAMRQFVERIDAQVDSPAVQRELEEAANARGEGASTLRSKSRSKQLSKQRLRWIRDRLTERGQRIARTHGWPNTYTLSKSLAESLLAERVGAIPLAIARPSIVETATDTPFAGWNEGINTSAPLSHLLGTHFRQVPSSEGKSLDMIPVDMVCRGMTLIAAALVQRTHASVYQLATSGVNPCSVGRVIELTGLAHRRFNLAAGTFRQRWLTRFDAIPVSKTRYLAISAPSQRRIVRSLSRIVAAAYLNEQPFVRAERWLAKLAKIIALYEPFILHNDQVFEAQNVRVLDRLLPADEQDVFGCRLESIDWWDYMINVHMPGLRRWVFPLIEGRPVEPGPVHPFALSTGAAAREDATVAKPAGDASSCPSS